MEMLGNDYTNSQNAPVNRSPGLHSDTAALHPEDGRSPTKGPSRADTPGSQLPPPSIACPDSLGSCPKGDRGAVCAPAQDGEVIN